MSFIDNLLRQRRRRCEEQQRHIAQLEQLAQRLSADALRLRVASERGSGAGGAAEGAALGERRATVERSLGAIERQLGEARTVLAVLETEMVRGELAAHQRGAARAAGREPHRRGRRPRAATPAARPPAPPLVSDD